jgi:hypothetical protein
MESTTHRLVKPPEFTGEDPRRHGGRSWYTIPLPCPTAMSAANLLGPLYSRQRPLLVRRWLPDRLPNLCWKVYRLYPALRGFSSHVPWPRLRVFSALQAYRPLTWGLCSTTHESGYLHRRPAACRDCTFSFRAVRE